jgi:hypothetical protein
MSLCTALFCANPVVKSGDHAGQTPFEIIILLNASKFYGYGDDCMCVCILWHRKWRRQPGDMER